MPTPGTSGNTRPLTNMHRNPVHAERSTLYVVATPVGNLSDITLRALDILGSVDWVAAEDTRVSGRLLQHYGLKAKLLALHAHNERGAAQRVIDLLGQGASVALVSDAGTPAISDPGALLVDAVRATGFRIEPIPGPSALTAAMSVARFAATPVLFVGFLPPRVGARRAVLDTLRNAPWSLVFYEAPHRISRTIADLASCLGGGRRVMLARELTKLYESVHVCPLDAATAWISADANRERGEFVIAVEALPAQDAAPPQLDIAHVLQTLLDELPVKQAVQLATRLTGEPRNALYEQALQIKKK
jgi:16S rRNA (cytidine1402-2'-O)-methyltransferase